MKMDEFEKWFLTFFKILSEKSKNVFVQFEMKSQESIEITKFFRFIILQE